MIATLSAILALVRHYTLRPPPGLTYDASHPDDMFEGFRLSEGLAAGTAAPPVSRRP